MRPKASTARSTAPAASSSLARSVGKVNARRLVCETSSLALSSSSSLLATSATSAPARARAIVVALPSPLLAPVTSATLPSRGRFPFTASLMLCHPPSYAMGKEACHVCELAASSGASAIVDAFFCQRYSSYTSQRLWRGLLRWLSSVLCRIYANLRNTHLDYRCTLPLPRAAMLLYPQGGGASCQTFSPRHPFSVKCNRKTRMLSSWGVEP